MTPRLSARRVGCPGGRIAGRPSCRLAVEIGSTVPLGGRVLLASLAIAAPAGAFVY